MPRNIIHLISRTTANPGNHGRRTRIGYHSEIVDQAAIWNEDAATTLRRDLAVMEAMLGGPVRGVASHGGVTGLNNLDFWDDHNAAEFGLSYEAYQDGLMEASRYLR